MVWHDPSTFTVTDENRLAAASPAPGSAAMKQVSSRWPLHRDLRQRSLTAAEAAMAPLVEVPPVGPKTNRNASI